MGLEIFLIPHGPDLADEITEINIADIVLAAQIDEVQNIKRPETAAFFAGIKVKIDRIHPFAADIDNAHTDELFAAAVLNLHRVGDGVGEKCAVIAHRRVALKRETLFEKAAAQEELFLGNPQLPHGNGQILILAENPLLIPVGRKFPGVDPDRDAFPAVRADHGVDGIAISPETRLQKISEQIIRQRDKLLLPVNRLLGQTIGALHGNIIEILQIFINGA